MSTSCSEEGAVRVYPCAILSCYRNSANANVMPKRERRSAHSPNSFCTRFSIESLLGSVGMSVSKYMDAMESKRTVGVVLGRNLEESGEGLGVLVDGGADLLCNLQAVCQYVNDERNPLDTDVLVD
jgi:hypothetical protein